MCFVRDILISSSICVFCLLLAFVSQVVAPSTVDAAPAPAAVVTRAAEPAQTAQRSSFELDPADPNPTLFAMAPDANQADASALGGPIEAADTRLTASGLSITDLTVGEGAEANAGQTVVVHYRGTLEDGTKLTIAACVVADIENGKIRHLREYLDSAAAAGLLKALS